MDSDTLPLEERIRLSGSKTHTCMVSSRGASVSITERVSSMSKLSAWEMISAAALRIRLSRSSLESALV